MKSKILCIGEILWDIFPNGSFLGGAPFNAACHLHMLGENVKIVSRIGDDPLGEKVMSSLKEKGIDPKYMQKDEKFRTGIVKVSINDVSNPSYEIVEPAAWDFIEVSDNLTEAALTADVLVFGSLAQRNHVSRNTIGILRKLVPVKVFDINLRPPYDNRLVVEDSLKNTQIVKLNDKELIQLAKWFGFPKEIKKSVLTLASEFNCSTVCVTRGEQGAVLWHNKAWTEHNGFKVSVKDTVGAGDAFLASMISGIMAGYTNEVILRNANAVGAYVASKNGATPILNFQEIKRFS